MQIRKAYLPLMDLKNSRVPAVPLVTHTPFVSVWSMSDRLTDDWTKHWTSTHNSITGLVRVDGTAYRFCGRQPFDVPALDQVGLTLSPTKSEYTFRGAGIELVVGFVSPLLADDLEILTRPVTYINLSVRSTDGAAHDVQAYLDITGEWCVDQNSQKVFSARHQIDGFTTLSFRASDQVPLKRSGDRVRIEWGTAYLCAPNSYVGGSTIQEQDRARSGFAKNGSLPKTDDLRFPRSVNDQWPVAAIQFDLGNVADAAVGTYAMVAYDEEYAFEFLGRKLVPYWKRKGMQVSDLLLTAASERNALLERCSAFDAKLTSELVSAGGETFAQLATLAYRQSIAAHGIAEEIDGMLLMLSKENDSNGCIGTVDVTYPGSPLYLYLNPTLLKAQVEPILKYASLPRWRFPFAPHDLGTYPLANGQVYGGGERTEEDQMPVEECGNMLILVSALCLREGSAAFAEPYWKCLTTWANYLLEKGLDPEHQLCTDDFAGHLAHNANLAIKAIVALGAFAKLAALKGDDGLATQLGTAAKEMASKWLELAQEGDHTRLAFDQAGTWAQKYNLVWDRLLGLGLFPDSLAASEIAYYKTKINEFGLPLDSRRDYTKLDWCVWTATLATTSEDFAAIIDPILHWCENTPDRVPMSDWYDTVSAKHMAFEARSVVGGVFMPMLKPI